MASCPVCESPAPEGSRYCPNCGSALDASAVETRTRPEAPHATRDRVRSFASHPSLDNGRFLPGDVVADRYRIVGLLGRGGMGEVYRADDLKVGQPVALKFLPEEMEGDTARQERFLNEVRMALRITHPNVCRVYDIGEVDGQHFISMEYVDGEDLASLLRRVGRLPENRGTAVARQICAGLAAAHEQGILHRDLKPANIMIDGRGRARITDFGLADIAAPDLARDRAGTPAYMAPEQLEGREVTERSDIYSLGLVLYEIFTGQRAFDAPASMAQLKEQRSSAPTSPTSHVEGIDPAIESVILRALEPDPLRRPLSVLGLAAALPGGDPLAAALAAGQTPSPEMVAGAATDVGMRRPVAIACLAVSLVALSLVTLLIQRSDLLAQTPWTLSPTELSIRAGDIASELGAPDSPAFVRDGLIADFAYLDRLREQDDTAARWAPIRRSRPPAVTYWMRAAPESFEPEDIHAFETSLDDPTSDPPGGVTVRLDTHGRLVGIRARWLEPGPARSSGVPVERLFELAGLELLAFSPIDPVLVPEAPGDSLQAWSDAPATPETMVHLGRLGGRVSSFDVSYPWHRASGGSGASVRARRLLMGFLYAGVILAAVFLARRNFRAGRGDRRGAFRLFLFFVAVVTGSWLFFDFRLHDFDLGRMFQQMVFGRAIAHGLLHATLAGLFYLALEPYVRRLWPEALISWSRLLIDGVRDPQVGRDVLVGATFGLSQLLLDTLIISLRAALDLPASELNIVDRLRFGGPVIDIPSTLGDLLIGIETSIGIPMLMLLMLMLVRLVTRRNWATALAVVLFFTMAAFLTIPGAGIGHLISTTQMIVFLSLIVFVMLRFGLLAAISFFFFYHALELPLTFDPSVWYAGPAFTALAGLVAILLFTFSRATSSTTR